jgi:hypothetical protein
MKHHLKTVTKSVWTVAGILFLAASSVQAVLRPAASAATSSSWPFLDETPERTAGGGGWT